MKNYYLVDEKRKLILSPYEKFIKSVKRCLNTDMLKGLALIAKITFKPKNDVTINYPEEKIKLDNRYRAVHRLQRFIESESERCIGCGLCEKICISNCIRMETKLGDDGRKVVNNYSINLGRCIYCGFCAEVCPELAIVHGNEYENAAQQRSYFAHKKDILTLVNDLENQIEFEGMGSLRKDADNFIKANPNYYEIKIHNLNSSEKFPNLNLNNLDSKEEKDV